MTTAVTLDMTARVVFDNHSWDFSSIDAFTRVTALENKGVLGKSFWESFWHDSVGAELRFQLTVLSGESPKQWKDEATATLKAARKEELDRRTDRQELPTLATPGDVRHRQDQDCRANG